MLLDRYMNTRLSSIKKPRAKYDPYMAGFWSETLEAMSSCKPYVLDEGTVDLCNSLVPDFEKEEALIDGVILPYDTVWVEFDRTKIIHSGHVKGSELVSFAEAPPVGPVAEVKQAEPGSFNLDPSISLANQPGLSGFKFDPGTEGADKKIDLAMQEVWDSSKPEKIGYLFEQDSQQIVISAVKSRRSFLVDPMVVGIVPKRSDGSLSWSDIDIALYEWVEELMPTTDRTQFEEWSTLNAFIHIPFVFFALLASKETGLDQTKQNSSFKARKVKDSARKAGLAGRVHLPEVTVLKLSEIGKRHLESIAADDREKPAAVNGKRSSPRRHFVRGHLVNREGKTFWRAPHPRGGGSPQKHTVTQVVDDLGIDGDISKKGAE